MLLDTDESDDSDPPPIHRSISSKQKNFVNNINEKLPNSNPINNRSKDESSSSTESNEYSSESDIERPTEHTRPIPLKAVQTLPNKHVLLTAQSYDPNSANKISPRDFIFGETVGQGSFGSVRVVRYKRDQKEYAMKTISKKFAKSEQKKRFALIERDAMNRLNHPNIIKLKMTFQDRDSLYYLLELAENRDLSSVLKKYIALSPKCSKVILAQVIHAIGHMHNRRVLHRDIKPENILLDSQNRVKISDFGTAKIFQLSTPSTIEEIIQAKTPNSPKSTNANRDSHFDYISKDNFDYSHSSFVGSTEYVSPEVLKFSQVGPPSDIWAFGCLVYTLFTGEPPFHTDSKYSTFEKITNCDYTIPEYVPKDARDLIEKILILDPTKRLGYKNYDNFYSDIKNHPFFEGINWQTITTQSPPEWESFYPPYRAYKEKLEAKKMEEEQIETEEQLIKQTPGQFIQDGSKKEIIVVLSNRPRLFLSDASVPIQTKADYTIQTTGHIFDSIAITPELKVEIVNSDVIKLSSPEKTLEFIVKDHSQVEQWNELLLAVLDEL